MDITRKVYHVYQGKTTIGLNIQSSRPDLTKNEFRKRIKDMKQALLAQRQAQKASYITRGEFAVKIDYHLLPDFLDPNKDWSVSATKQWNADDMTWLKDAPYTELIEGLGDDPEHWLIMGVTAELILHEDNTRAKAFAQGIVNKHPQARQVLNQYFGDTITSELLTVPIG